MFQFFLNINTQNSEKKHSSIKKKMNTQINSEVVKDTVEVVVFDVHEVSGAVAQ